jgi:hypothetical protein
MTVRLVRVILISCLSLPALGCAQYEQQRAAEEARAIAANDDAQCRSYGATPGSEAYVACRMNLDNQRAHMRGIVASHLLRRM